MKTLTAMMLVAVAFAAPAKQFEGMAYTVLFVLLGVGTLVIAIDCAVAKRRSRRASEALARHVDENYRKWLSLVESNGGKLPEYESPIPLDAGEVCVLAVQDTTMSEPRAVRRGGGGGVSIHIAKGITYHTGSFGSEAREEWRAIDKGTFCITSVRVVFCGAANVRTVKLDDILSFDARTTELLLSSRRRQKTMLFSGLNAKIAYAVIDSAMAAASEAN